MANLVFELDEKFFDKLARAPAWETVVQYMGETFMEKSLPHLSPDQQGRFERLRTDWRERFKQELMQYASASPEQS